MKQKKLKLKASQRDNRRYLLISESNEKVERAILEYIGILGFAKAAYMPVKTEKGKLIAAVRREELDKVRGALALAGINVLRVSGTLKGLKS